MLARAGLYGSVTEDGQGGISNIKLEHVWVKVTIDGNDYEFDPSFKSHTTKGGLTLGTLKQAMGYNQTDFLTKALEDSDSGDYWIKELNKDNIDSDLATYSINLISYIKENLSDGGLADVIGGRSITQTAERYSELWRQEVERWLDEEHERRGFDPAVSKAASEALLSELEQTTEKESREGWERLMAIMRKDEQE